MGVSPDFAKNLSTALYSTRPSITVSNSEQTNQKVTQTQLKTTTEEMSICAYRGGIAVKVSHLATLEMGQKIDLCDLVDGHHHQTGSVDEVTCFEKFWST